jgi:hypothetical protein
VQASSSATGEVDEGAGERATVHGRVRHRAHGPNGMGRAHGAGAAGVVCPDRTDARGVSLAFFFFRRPRWALAHASHHSMPFF